jgi:SAM-dependent methyltransferase
MRCIRCKRLNDDTAWRCECGFKFDRVEPEELPGWFDEVKTILETVYLAAPTPWQQSGKSGTFEEWTRVRIPISECITAPGTFLDIGCANGFLLDCLQHWTRFKGMPITPHGLDYSEKLIALAQERLPGYRDNLFVGNAWDWFPPRRFDYVRTEAVYVPRNYQQRFIRRLLDDFVTPGGKLLVAEYRSKSENLTDHWIDETLGGWGFPVERTASGFNGTGLEVARIAVVPDYVGRGK